MPIGETTGTEPGILANLMGTDHPQYPIALLVFGGFLAILIIWAVLQYRWHTATQPQLRLGLTPFMVLHLIFLVGALTCFTAAIGLSVYNGTYTENRSLYIMWGTLLWPLASGLGLLMAFIARSKL